MTKQHWSKDCAAAKQERDKLKHQLAECQQECEEQARLNGMGSEREARLIAKVEELEKQLANYVPQFCVTESTQLKQFVKEAYDELGSYYCNIEAVRKKLKEAINEAN
jgi:chromosome segregation ATPase